MKDVGAEYSAGPKHVIQHITQKLFNSTSSDAEQWQLLAAQVIEHNMQMGAMSKARFLKRDLKGSRKNNFTFLCADASCLAALPKRRNISIFLRFGALPGRRLNT
jgi:hypothetical protein